MQKKNLKLVHYLLRKEVIDLITGCWFVKNETKKDCYRKIYIKELEITTTLARLSAMVFLEFDINNKLNLEICHKCDIKACFNPDHLYIGTHGSNKRDWFAREARISENHCIHGHEYTLNKNGKKICRECQKLNYYNSLRKYWPNKAEIFAKKHNLERIN